MDVEIQCTNGGRRYLKAPCIWWNQYRGGLDSAIITTAPEHDGIRCTPLRRAIKMRPEAPNVCVEGDASVLLLLLGADLFRGE